MLTAALMAAQQAQHTKHMVESHAMNAANAQQEHSQRLMSERNESQRALKNDQTKRSTQAQADQAALLKDTMQKLESGSAA